MACETCGHVPDYQEIQRQQEPYRGMWQAFMAWEQAAHDRDNPIYPGDLRRAIMEIVDNQPPGSTAFALATTRYGREDMEGL